MENALLYVVIAAGIAMILAGAYGAAPALFPHQRLHPEGGHSGLSQAFTLGAAFPLLEDDLTKAFAITAIAGARPAATTAAEPETETAPEVDLGGFDDEPYDGSPAVDAELLTDLMTEIELLRGQIEVLRSELGAFSRSAAPPAQPNAPGGESRRRARGQSTADLPPPLRRQVVDIRKHRRSA